MADASTTFGLAAAMTVATGLAIAGSFRWLLADHNLATVARAIRATTAQLMSVFAEVEAQCSGLLFPEIRTLRDIVRRELLRAKKTGPAALALLQAEDASSGTSNFTGNGQSSFASLPGSIPGSKATSPTKPPLGPAGALSQPTQLVSSLSFHSLGWPTTTATSVVAADSQRNRKDTPSPTREAAKRASLGRAKASSSSSGRSSNLANGKTHVKAKPSSASVSSADAVSISNLSLNDSDAVSLADDTQSLADSATGYADDVNDSPLPAVPTVSTLRNTRVTLSLPVRAHSDRGHRPKLPQITTSTLERHLRSLEDRLTRALEKMDSVRASEQGMRDTLLQSGPVKSPNPSNREASRSHTADLELASHPKIAAQISETVECVRRKKSSLTKTIHRGLDMVDALLEIVCDPSASNIAVVLPPGHEKLGECVVIGEELEMPVEEPGDEEMPVSPKDGSPTEDKSLPSPGTIDILETIAKLMGRLPELERFEDMQAANEAALIPVPAPAALPAEEATNGEMGGTPPAAASSEPKANGHAPHAAQEQKSDAANELWKLASNPTEAWSAASGLFSGLVSEVTARAGDTATWAKQQWASRSQ